MFKFLQQILAVFDLLRHRTYTAEIAELQRENHGLRTALRNSQRENRQLQGEREKHKAAAKRASAFANQCAADKKKVEKHYKQLKEDHNNVKHAHIAAQERSERYRAYIDYLLGNENALYQHQQKWSHRVTVSELQCGLENILKKTKEKSS